MRLLSFLLLVLILVLLCLTLMVAIFRLEEIETLGGAEKN